jgi:uncharacterized protein YfaS (alpha-2-macroglobulin family)
MPYFLAAGIFAAAVGILFTNRSALAAQMENWQLLPLPQRFTELYFVNQQHLPAQVTQGSMQKVTFAVHNLEHQTIKYTYKLSLELADSSKQDLATDTFSIGHDQTQTIAKTITMPALLGRTSVQIDLSYQGVAFGSATPSPQAQAIHFWVQVKDHL